MKQKHTHKASRVMFQSGDGEWRQLDGVVEFTIEREIPDDVLPMTFDPCPKIEGNILLSKAEAEGLFRMLFGYQEFTAAQCVALAERIAFGAWAVRCAERLVSK